MVALQKIISQYPQEAQAYYAVSLILGVGGRTNEAFDALGKAIQLNPAFRDKARNDPQFGSIRNDPRFQKLLNP
jgi:tetratricopeptide (TPR) repeat protein